MPNKTTFDDPLDSIDPIMEEAFSNKTATKEKKATHSKKIQKRSVKKTHRQKHLRVSKRKQLVMFLFQMCNFLSYLNKKLENQWA